MYTVASILPSGKRLMSVSRDLDGALTRAGNIMAALENLGFHFVNDAIDANGHRGTYTYERGRLVYKIEVSRS